jgi:hypothetical protein
MKSILMRSCQLLGPRLRIDPDMIEGNESWPTHGQVMAKRPEA